MTKMRCPQNVTTAMDVDGDERQKVRGKTVGREEREQGISRESAR